MIQRIKFTEETDEEGFPTELGRVVLSGTLHTLFSDGRVLPVVRGGATDDDPDDPDDDDLDDDDDDDDDKPSPDDIKDPEKKRLSDEAARHRLRAKKAKQRADDLQAKLDAKEAEENDKDKPDLAKLQKERDDAVAKAEDLGSAVNTLTIANAVRDEVAELDLNPKKIKAIIKVMDVDDIEVDDDGEVTGVREALEAVKKDYPEWIVKASGKDDDEDDDDAPTSGGSTSGKPPAKKKGKGIDREALAQKFAALR